LSSVVRVRGCSIARVDEVLRAVSSRGDTGLSTGEVQEVGLAGLDKHLMVRVAVDELMGVALVHERQKTSVIIEPY